MRSDPRTCVIAGAGLAGDDADRIVPGMRAHLVGCPACLEDHASLLAFAASSDDGEAPPR